jgi:hypothetical protein
VRKQTKRFCNAVRVETKRTKRLTNAVRVETDRLSNTIVLKCATQGMKWPGATAFLTRVLMVSLATGAVNA